MHNSSIRTGRKGATGTLETARTAPAQRREQGRARVGLGLVAVLLFGCQGSTTNNDPNFRQVDSRRSLGNPLVGQTCDDRSPCPADGQGNMVRCATARQFDAVGFCSPSCKTDADCDTQAPGLARCTNMNGRAECVLFCDRNYVQTSKLCPDGWTCEPIQSYYMCAPPQQRPDAGS